jgi:uridylate kinase
MPRVAQEIADIKAKGYEICIVVGGGNIFRGMAGAARAVTVGSIERPDGPIRTSPDSFSKIRL